MVEEDVRLNNFTVSKVCNYEQLQEIFRQAQAQNTPVSLYNEPQPGGISLDVSSWNNVEVFDVENLMAIVPPGMLLKDLREMAATKGLRFIPADTPFLESLSIGEWAYRGCHNLSGWKYAAGKHFLLGASYVFPNGDMAPVGGQCIKNVTGYDFTRFLHGAYADFGVGVRYIIKLMPQPAYRYRFDACVNSLERAIEIIDNLQAYSVPPAWLFWADEVASRKLFGQEHRHHRLLVELDGNEAEVRDYQTVVSQMMVNETIQPSAAAIPNVSFLEADAADFWLMDEFKLPSRTVPAFRDRFNTLLKEEGMTGGLFGQLADGKIHIYVERQRPAAVLSLIKELQQTARSLGGSFSGKYTRLYGGAEPSTLAALETEFKKLIDPGLIFNRREVAVQ